LVEKLSALIFSRNGMHKTLSLIGDVYDYVDEIVLIDSSDERVHEALLHEKNKRKLKKLRVFYAVALGYPDPLRMYALSKCRYDWILLIDTDERLSPSLKSDLHRLIHGADYVAFSIRRYEDVDGAKKGAYTNWQTRLFKKSRISYRGMIHEEPIVSGSTLKLVRNDYFMDHVNKLRSGTAKEYSVMERFFRMSYRSFNDRFVDQFHKITVPKRQDAAGSFGGSMNSFLRLYEKLGNKNLDDEISDFDYFAFYYLYAVMTNLKLHRPSGVIMSYKDGRGRLGLIKEWRRSPDGDTEFEISKTLYRIGLIRFLELDNGRTILKINKRYRNKEAGIGLLIKLLKLRYEKGKRGLD
jgi:hypothetical protein